MNSSAEGVRTTAVTVVEEVTGRLAVELRVALLVISSRDRARGGSESEKIKNTTTAAVGALKLRAKTGR
jgi:hypothetical protein